MELVRGAGLGDAIRIPMSDFVGEHKKLVGVLKHGTRKQQLAEARDQSAELKKQLKGGAYTIEKKSEGRYHVMSDGRVYATASSMKEAKAIVARERRGKTMGETGDAGESEEVARAFGYRTPPSSPKGERQPPPPPKKKGMGLTGGMDSSGAMAKWKDVAKQKAEEAEKRWTKAERDMEKELEQKANKKGMTRIYFHGVAREVPIGDRRKAIVERMEEAKQLRELGKVLAGKGQVIARMRGPARVAPAPPPPPPPPARDPTRTRRESAVDFVAPPQEEEEVGSRTTTEGSNEPQSRRTSGTRSRASSLADPVATTGNLSASGRVKGGNQKAGFIRRMMAETKKKHGGEPYGDEDADASYRNPTRPLAPDTTMKAPVAFDYFSMPKESRAMSKHIMDHFFKIRPYGAGEREELNEYELQKLRTAEAERQRRSRARRRGEA